MRGARVSEFFSQRIQIKKKHFLGGRGAGGVGRGGGLLELTIYQQSLFKLVRRP